MNEAKIHQTGTDEFHFFLLACIICSLDQSIKCPGSQARASSLSWLLKQHQDEVVCLPGPGRSRGGLLSEQQEGRRDGRAGAAVQVRLAGPHRAAPAQLSVLGLQAEWPRHRPARGPEEFQAETLQHEISQHQRPAGGVG